MSIEKKLLSVLAAAALTASVGALSVNAVGLGESGSNCVEFYSDGVDTVTVSVPIDYVDYGDAKIVAEFEGGMLPEGGYKLVVKRFVDAALAVEFENFVYSDGAVPGKYIFVDISLYNSAGEEVHLVTPILSLVTQMASYFDGVAVYEDGTFSWLRFNGDYVDGRHDEYTITDPNRVSGEAPHLSRFVFASIVRETSFEPEPDPVPESDPIAPPPEYDDDDSSDPEDRFDSRTEKPDTSKTNTSTTDKSTVSQTSTAKPNDKDDYKTGDNGSATAIVFAVMSIAAIGTAIFASKAKKSSK